MIRSKVVSYSDIANDRLQVALVIDGVSEAVEALKVPPLPERGL
jgi:hypothetical protein